MMDDFKRDCAEPPALPACEECLSALGESVPDRLAGVLCGPCERARREAAREFLRDAAQAIAEWFAEAQS